MDGESLEAFEERLEERLGRLHEELKTDPYRPLPVRQTTDPEGRQAGRVSPAGHPDDLSIGYANRRC